MNNFSEEYIKQVIREELEAVLDEKKKKDKKGRCLLCPLCKD
jgi:hypothetical protein